jgi:hypothetical protein
MRLIRSVVTASYLAAILAVAAAAQDKSVPKPTVPSAPNDYSREAPEGGLLARQAQALVVTPRGAFGLGFNEAGHTLFEWAAQGYDETLTYLGYKQGYLYFKVTNWAVVVAIRNEAVNGVHPVWFFINGGTDPHFHSQGPAYPVRR